VRRKKLEDIIGMKGKLRFSDDWRRRAMSDRVLVDTSVWISFFRHADHAVSEDYRPFSGTEIRPIRPGRCRAAARGEKREGAGVLDELSARSVSAYERGVF